jgi:hypothetical protein
MASQVPEEYLCPINLTLMNDPVIGSDGRSYERAAITQWLHSNPHSPITRQPMTVSSLKPNYALKTAIERFTAAQRRPEPVIMQVSAPSAPPHDDVYYAMQVYQHDMLLAQQQQLLLSQQQQLRYGQLSAQTVVVPIVAAEQRRKKALFTCICVTIAIILIIIVSRMYIAANN